MVVLCVHECEVYAVVCVGCSVIVLSVSGSLSRCGYQQWRGSDMGPCSRQARQHSVWSLGKSG